MLFFLTGLLFVGFSLFLVLFAAWLFFHALSMLRGAPYVESRRASIDFAKAVFIGRKKIADIGSGNGRMLLAMAEALDAELHGYEINPFLVWQSRRRIRRAGLASRVHVHWRNLWSVDFSPFDAVYIYGLPPIMKKLGDKLQRELEPGTLIVSAAFPFPDWQPIRSDASAFLYQIKPLQKPAGHPERTLFDK